eukprot:gene8682-629_t
MSMSSLTDALELEKSVEDSLKNLQGVTGLGVLDPNGSILSKAGSFDKKPELLEEIFQMLKDVRGLVKKEKVENITVNFDTYEYIICFNENKIYVVLKNKE